MRSPEENIPRAPACSTKTNGEVPDLDGVRMQVRIEHPTALISYRCNSLYDAVMPSALELAREKLPEFNLQIFSVPVGTDLQKIPDIFEGFLAKEDSPTLKPGDFVIADNTTANALGLEANHSVINLDALVGESLQSAMGEKFGARFNLFLDQCDGKNDAERFVEYEQRIREVLREILLAVFPTPDRLPQEIVIFTSELGTHYPFAVLEDNGVDCGALLAELFKEIGMNGKNITVARDVVDLLGNAELGIDPETLRSDDLLAEERHIIRGDRDGDDSELEERDLDSDRDENPVTRGRDGFLAQFHGRTSSSAESRDSEDDTDFLQGLGDDLLLRLSDAKSVIFIGDRHVLNSQIVIDQLASHVGISQIEALKYTTPEKTGKTSKGKSKGKGKESDKKSKEDELLEQGTAELVLYLRELLGLGDGTLWNGRFTSWLRFPLENWMVDVNRVGLVDGTKSITPELLIPLVANRIVNAVREQSAAASRNGHHSIAKGANGSAHKNGTKTKSGRKKK